LEAAAACGDRLVVGVAEDDTVQRVKGKNRPIYPLEHRIALLEACRYVDAVDTFSLESQLDLVAQVSPDICVEGEDGNARLREIIQELGLKISVQTVYTDFIHTTDIVQRILLG
jgi:cytidyltransferase-like protein